MNSEVGIGHNNPPDPLIVEANERVDAASRWLTERGDAAKWDAAIADRGNFFITQLHATWDALDKQRLQEGRDFKKKQDEKYSDPLTLLVTAESKLNTLKRAYLKAEEDKLAAAKREADAKAEAARKAAEDAESRAQEAATKKGGDPLRAELDAKKAKEVADQLAEAAAVAPQKAVITGAYSTRATGLKDSWSAEITDLSAAFKHYNGKKHPSRTILATAIETAIKSIADREARLLKTEDAANFPPGIKFIKERK